MDNASKALIMAGSILISVALVGIGVYLYSTTSNQIDSTSRELSATQIQLQNSEFELYEGNNKDANAVKNLIRKVAQFNLQKIFPNDIEISGDVITVSDVVDTEKYDIKMIYDDANKGYLRYIKILR